MTENETPTIGTVQVLVKRLENDVSDANAGVAKANTQAEKMPRKTLDEMRAAVAVVDQADITLEGTESKLKSAQKQLATLEWATKSAKLAASTGRIEAAFKSAVLAERAVLAEFHVTTITTNVTGLDTDSPVASAKHDSPDAPKRLAGAKRPGGNRGTWECEGMGSHDFVAAHVDQLTDTVRDQFNTQNYRAFSMTREANRIADKLNLVVTTK